MYKIFKSKGKAFCIYKISLLFLFLTIFLLPLDTWASCQRQVFSDDTIRFIRWPSGKRTLKVFVAADESFRLDVRDAINFLNGQNTGWRFELTNEDPDILIREFNAPEGALAYTIPGGKIAESLGTWYIHWVEIVIDQQGNKMGGTGWGLGPDKWCRGTIIAHELLHAIGLDHIWETGHLTSPGGRWDPATDDLVITEEDISEMKEADQMLYSCIFSNPPSITTGTSTLVKITGDFDLMHTKGITITPFDPDGLNISDIVIHR